MQPTELQTLLDNLAQPAFAVNGDVVALVNRGAEEKLLRVGDRLSPYRVGKDVFLLCGMEYEANVQSFGSYDLYFLSPAANTKPLSAAAFHAAQSLRDPLQSLVSTFSTLFPKLEELENDEIQGELSHINRAFFRLMRLSCNLSDLYLALDGQMKLHYGKIELTDFLYDIYLRTESLCRLCGITLNVKLPQQTLCAWIDAQKVERLVLNLLCNALKFSAPGDEITLELTKPGRFAVISVTDCGEGISEDVLSDAYCRFERPLYAEDARYGFGAGLSLCRKIAELHGGSMMLTPNLPRGTCATVRLPLAKPSDEALVESPLAKTDYAGGLPHAILELSDVLPSEVFDTENVN